MDWFKTDVPQITPEQCRAARAVLRWTVKDTVEASGISLVTVVKFEAGGDVRPALVGKLRAAIVAAGVIFADDGKGLSWG